ncbi:hypothetical protein QFC21_003484 [Naganishia friedmannii]|uniref:Uncharacterized protein n=1 Tax=Naganishia friedmannii TaxID=89922 RepID=A0ACC2VQV6_9TREE|nr:hypothetical protein QFC21_003484 [Naganishia friedmannii]
MSPTDSQPKSKPTLAPASTVGGSGASRSPIRLVQDTVQVATTLARLFFETLLSPLFDPNSWMNGPTLSSFGSSSGSGSTSGSGGSRLGSSGGGSWFGGGESSNGGRSGGSGNGGGGGGRRLGTIGGLNGSGRCVAFVWLSAVFDFEQRWSLASWRRGIVQDRRRVDSPKSTMYQSRPSCVESTE